jgi:2-oxoisovalerate dehydrogenase E1 component alpha subunit
MGVLLWRGFGLPAVMSQCFGNKNDKATKGRQMPMVGPHHAHVATVLTVDVQHFGAKHLHFHTISSPLGTQIPQAAGVGYALKRDPLRRDKNIAAVYMGDGAASEGTAHPSKATRKTNQSCSVSR